MSSTTSAAASATSSASAGLKANPKLKIVGIILAILSGLLIGSSFVFKKKGLLRSQAGASAGEGVAYLKSTLWWTGMIMMILGELCNFAAYAFIEAIVVTPLGALSVVICAILSSFFLNEKLSLFGWLGCILCILGSTIIALNGPREESIGEIREFEKLFIAPGFLVFAGMLILISLVIIFYFAPRYGKTNMLWYIAVCSMIGGISVSVTTGLGSAIVTTAQGDNQFNYWFTYFLLIFVAVTLITEVYYLNVALALFNTAMVTPTYYVSFTFCSMVTTVVLFKGLKASASQIITVVLAFFCICIGITILQMSKIDPQQLTGLDRRSTMLLQAARSNTQAADEEKISAVEDPGIDALRGSFGAFGSIVRAKSARRMSMASRASTMRSRHNASAFAHDEEQNGQSVGYGAQEDRSHYPGLRRHQLYDNPVPPLPPLPDGLRSSPLSAGGALPPPLVGRTSSASTVQSAAPPRNPTIKFGAHDLVHSYEAPGATNASGAALHEFQATRGRSRREDPTLVHSSAATIGIGVRGSDLAARERFLEQESAADDDSTASISGSGAPSTVVTGHGGRSGGPLVSSPVQENAPPTAIDTRFRRTADTQGTMDTVLSGGGVAGRDAYPRGQPQPGYSLESKDSLGSFFGGEDDDLLRRDAAAAVQPPFLTEDQHRRSGESQSSPRRGLFGRSESPRKYPGTVVGTDADESKRLWKNPGSVSSSSEGGLSDDMSAGGGSMSPGGIRLVNRPAQGSGRL